LLEAGEQKSGQKPVFVLILPSFYQQYHMVIRFRQMPKPGSGGAEGQTIACRQWK
jgi:hypothetical protein